MKLTLARTITCSDESCKVQLLGEDSVTDAPLSPRMIQIGTRIRPGMIVALDLSATPPMIRWRFETRPVQALAGDRITILGRESRFVDARPENDRATPIRVGDIVTIRQWQAGDEIEVYDTVVDGQPQHPEFLEADYPRIEAAYQGTARS
jgi:hypothetical protein